MVGVLKRFTFWFRPYHASDCPCFYGGVTIFEHLLQYTNDLYSPKNCA